MPRKTIDQQRRERLGELIRARRVELGLTKVQLAANAHLGRGDVPNGRTVYNLEAGKTRPNESTQYGIERALGWRRQSISRFLAGGDEPTTSDLGPQQVERDDALFVYRLLADADAGTFAQVRAVLEQVEKD